MLFMTGIALTKHESSRYNALSTASAVATTKLKGNHAARKLSLMIGADVPGCGPT